MAVSTIGANAAAFRSIALIAFVLMQAVSGLGLLVKRWKTRRGTTAWLHALSPDGNT
jgi:hypothetical protein